jgi:hypothetical protein
VLGAVPRYHSGMPLLPAGLRPIVLLVLAAALAGDVRPHPSAPTVVRLLPSARDSMSRVFARFNQGWDQQQDLNTMERMLGTVRKGTLEYLGCLAGEVRGDTVVVTHLVDARGLRQLPQAVTGRCDSLSGIVGTWHTHPYHADTLNRAKKSPELSFLDLKTFAASEWAVQVMMWDVDSLDAATKDNAGDVRHPAWLDIAPAAP